MKKKKLFYKNKNNSLFLFIIIFLLILLFIFFINYKKKNTFFEISEFKNIFYIIPEDKGGIKVQNLDKKALHFSDINQTSNLIDIDPILEFSIQIYSSENYINVKNKYNKLLINNKNKEVKDILNPDNFYIINFNNLLGNEYILVYKNFSNREKALEYCLSFNITPKCLIINVKNLD